MLKIIFAVLLALVLLVAVVALVGSRLPVAHVATRTVTLPVSPDSIFSVVTDFASAPSWRTDLKRVDPAPDGKDGRQRFTEVSSNGAMTMEVEESTPPTRLVTRIVGEDLPFGGAWAFDIRPEGTGSRVTISEHGEVYNPVFRFISRYVMGHATTLDKYLRNLGAKFGVQVTPEDASPVRR